MSTGLLQKEGASTLYSDMNRDSDVRCRSPHSRTIFLAYRLTQCQISANDFRDEESNVTIAICGQLELGLYEKY